jgi:integrase
MGATMGFSRKRPDRNGKVRYTAYYIDSRGRERSAGTFAQKKRANDAWQQAEAKIAEGRLGDPRRGRQTFETYVENEWLPNHMIEPSTRQGYTYSLRKNILPNFGPMRMVDILPSHVREWVQELHAAGMTPATIRSNKVILSAILTTALNDQVINFHPCRGIKTPTVPRKLLRIITPVQFNIIYAALPDEVTRLLIETDIESGLRWGELTELRGKDLDFDTGLLTISRAVVQLDPKFHPTGERFYVKEYPKDREPRRLMLSQQVLKKLRVHVDDLGLGQDDLLFSIPDPLPRSRSVTPLPAAGLTLPNDEGRQYKHGTLSGYAAGKCKCTACRAAYAIYRAGRRAAGKDSPRQPRRLDTDGHIPRDWFRTAVWNPAVNTACPGIHVRPHDLRHAHASWLLAGGADLQVVKERLGHSSIATTEKYLHTLPNADTTALTALDKIRRGVA